MQEQTGRLERPYKSLSLEVKEIRYPKKRNKRYKIKCIGRIYNQSDRKENLRWYGQKELNRAIADKY